MTLPLPGKFWQLYFSCHYWEAVSIDTWCRPGGLLNSLHCTEESITMKNYHTQNVNKPKAEKLCPKDVALA